MLETAARVLVRAGAVCCLLLAAISLAVGVNEYPGYTRPALRYMATDVMPMVLVGLISVAALQERSRRGQWLRLLAMGGSLALLISELQSMRGGGPPIAYLLAGAAGLLAVGMIGVAVSTHQRER